MRNNPIPEHALFDMLKAKHKMKTDRELAAFLETTTPAISKVRHGMTTVGAALILKIHKATKMKVSDIEEWLNGSNT